MRDISREGGFTTGVLTHYFPDKEAVIHGAFAAASDDWTADARARLAMAGSAEDQLVALVDVALPRDDGRRAEWRLWSEMWTYAGRDSGFAARLVATDAAWEADIRAVLEHARTAGVIHRISADVEARVLARLIDGIGLRAWLSGRWDDARDLLVAHLATLGVDEALQQRMRHDTDRQGGDG